MNLPELSIRRHVLAYMLSGVIVLFGIIAFRDIGIDRLPKVDLPIVSVVTRHPGANPEIVDASITNIVERQVNSVPGIDYIQSSSTPATSSVTVTFELTKSIDVAFTEVQAKISQILDRLPDDADPPVVAKVETDASPILWLHLQGDRTLQQLNVYAQNVLRRQIETIDGVGDIRIGGLRARTIRVELDPVRLAARALTVQDIVSALENEHLLLPGGYLVGKAQERLVKLDLEYHSPQALARMVVGYRDGAPLKLGDVADIDDALADFRAIARRDGKPVVGLGIVKVSGSNSVAIIDEVKRRLDEEIRPQLPPGMTIRVGSDTSVFILEMIAALEEHLISGTLLAGLVVLLFLRSLRATLIIAAAIPVSLLGAVAVMYFAGYTFNSMTLLGLLLLVGVVVDDAIVVLENIHRHREEIDPSPYTAAVNGAAEVMFAVLAATLSLVAIFLPVLFMGGMMGRFFESFAVVVVSGVLVSWFVSLTLTPALCARFLGDDKVRHHGRVYHALGRALEAMDRGYQRLLTASLARPWVVLASGTAVVMTSVFFFGAVGKEFMPKVDEGRFLVFFKAPLGANVNYTVSRMDEVEKVLAGQPDIAQYFTAIGLFQQTQANEGMAFVTMKPRGERQLTQQEMIVRLRPLFGAIPGVRAFATEVPAIGGQRGEPLQFAVRGPNLSRVGEYAEQMRARLAQLPGMGYLDLDLQLNMPQLVLEVDRTRAASLGLTGREVALAANVLAGGVDVAKFNDAPGDGERYDIRLKAREGVFETPADMRKIFLRSANGELVRLDTVAQFREQLGPARMDRFDLQYAARFYGDPEMPLAEALSQVRAAATDILPAGYTITLLGSSRELSKTLGYVLFAFALAIALLYMVLASQFDSFVQPVVIMLALPPAMVGGLAALWLVGATLNIYSMIGLILLIGLVAKNSILLVDRTNQMRQAGMNIQDALRAACPVRLRPVLMTSFTVILAMLPAALGFGAGADTNGPLAVAVIGGMLTSTLLTLVVVPVAYGLVEGWVLRYGRRHAVHAPG